MFRQSTNWASRQGFTEGIRVLLMKNKKEKKLGISEEILAGTVGGCLSTWNQPFEVARIYMQSAANEGKIKQGLASSMKSIYSE